MSQVKYSTKRNKCQYRSCRQKTTVLSKLLTSEAKLSTEETEKRFFSGDWEARRVKGAIRNKKSAPLSFEKNTKLSKPISCNKKDEKNDFPLMCLITEKGLLYSAILYIFIFSRIKSSAFFSSLDTCTWEIPSFAAI